MLLLHQCVTTTTSHVPGNLLTKLIQVTNPHHQVSAALFWSWSRPPQVEFSLVTPAPTHNRKTAIETVRSLLAHINKPDYALTGKPDKRLLPQKPVIWSPVEIIKIREACQLARKVLDEVKEIVEPGITTDELDRFAREYIVIHNAYPSPLNFNRFPKSISTSVNNIAAHGIPDSRELVSGDILNIDVTVYLDGFHGDCSETVSVGDVDHHSLHLIKVIFNISTHSIYRVNTTSGDQGVFRPGHRVLWTW